MTASKPYGLGNQPAVKTVKKSASSSMIEALEDAERMVFIAVCGATGIFSLLICVLLYIGKDVV